MNEEQRKGLEELSAWKATLHTEQGDDRPAQPLAAASSPASTSSSPSTTSSESFQPEGAEALESSNGEQVAARAVDVAPDPPDAPPAADVATRGEDDQDGAIGAEKTPDADDAEDEDEDERAKRRPLVDWLIVMAVALLAAFLIRTFVLAHFVVDGTSMVSTLEDGDRVFVNKLSYRLHDPRRGDVVVLHQLDGTSQRDLIKRVIALPGETIEIRSCEVLIDGQLLVEPYLDPQVVRPGNCGGNFAEVEVPSDHVFVMGDNRAGSQDSRMLGTIDEDELVGRAFVVFWPTSNWRWL